MRNHWRRFKSRRNDTATTLVMPSDLVTSMHRVMNEAMSTVYGNRHHITVDELKPLLQQLSERTAYRSDAATWFALLVARAPGAARAQEHMDSSHPHNVGTQQAWLYQLIDFNDAFVSTVIALDERDRETFLDVAQREIRWFCKQVDSRMFSDEQFEAITRGLTREIAVYLGAQQVGYEVKLTTRSQDAMGIDMIITDPGNGKVLNVDCKTPSAYRYRIQDLEREGRLSEAAAEAADLEGFTTEVNGHDDEAVSVVLLRIDPNEVGDIENFAFTDPSLLGLRLKTIFARYYIKNIVDSA